MENLFSKIVNYKGKLSLLKPGKNPLIREISQSFGISIEEALTLYHLIREINEKGRVNTLEYKKKKRLSEDNYLILLGRLVELGTQDIISLNYKEHSLYPIITLKDKAFKILLNKERKPFNTFTELISFISDILKEKTNIAVKTPENIWREIELRSKRLKIVNPIFKRYLYPYTVEERIFILTLIAKEKLNQNDWIYSFDYILDALFESTSRAASFWKKLYTQTLKSIEDGVVIIKSITENIGEGSITVNDEVLKYAEFRLKSIAETARESMKSKFFSVLEPSKREEKLFFPDKIRKTLNLIESAISKDRFEKIKKELSKKGFPSGIVALFYGAPGTGKTASVYELGRRTGRKIFQVDLSSIKEKWLGSSEKNMKKVFSEYYKYLDSEKIAPILLLNEADGVISKRVAVERSVDQTLNTIQNILLEELEKFEGICIATTNLDINMDDAFSRRFLFKIEFTPPEYELRKLIWKEKFPEFSEEEYSVLAEKELTGAEIFNIAKKVELQAIITGEKPTIDEILNLIYEEKNYKAENKVGFLSN